MKNVAEQKSIFEVASGEIPLHENILVAMKLHYHIGESTILEDVNVPIRKNKVTAVIGPSGSGKTSFLRCSNRMDEVTSGASITGKILFNGEDIVGDCDIYDLRRKIGMVFQKVCVFPGTIYRNVIFGVSRQSFVKREAYDSIVEEKLKQISLWDDVKDRLHDNAFGLSLGQQQRLCIARTLALDPDVILMDEPTASLDPKSTRAIEVMIQNLKEKHTIIIVTHNLQQARRIADDVIFICKGRICEMGEVGQFFENPCKEETKEYIVGIG